jgi:hypothetical protein
LRLTIAAALLVLVALVAAGVVRLDDRGELTTDLIAAAPVAPSPASLPADPGPDRPDGPARVAVVPDKAAAQAAEGEAAAAAAVESAAVEAAAQVASTTSPPASAVPPAPAAQPAQARPPAPAPTPATSPPPTQPPSGGGSLYAKLDNIARCESGMNPTAYNPAGPYLGAFQFHLSTWRGLGESGDPRNRSYSYQRDVAARLQQRSGWGSWPHCSAKYGY